MLSFEFCRPTNYIFGRYTENQAARLITNLGYKKVLLVYGCGSCVKSGLLDKVVNLLEQADIDVVTLGGVEANPKADLVYRGISLSREHQIEFILAVGGGSVIDTAKAIALGVPDEGDFFDFFLGKRVPKQALKTGIILTIAAAGSEGSINTVIEKEIDGHILKKSCSNKLNLPEFAILNPEITFSVSQYQTACGVCEMICRILEYYFTNTQDVSVSDRLCEGLLLSIIDNALIVKDDPENYEVRANLMWACTLAHSDLCGAGRENDWAAHNLGQQLSALYNIPYGAGLAVVFPAWMEFTYKHDVMRFVQFASRIFGCAVNFDDPESTARAGIESFREFLFDLGLPLSFEDLGAKDSDIPLLLNMLGVDDVNRTEGNFMILHRRECEQIYSNAANYNSKHLIY